MTARTGMTKVAGAAPYIAKVPLKNDGAKFEVVSAHQRKYNSVIKSRKPESKLGTDEADSNTKPEANT